MLKNKPHVWLNKSAAVPVLEFKVDCTDGYGILEDDDFYTLEAVDDILYVKYQMQRGIETPEIVRHDLATGGIYNSRIHNKVVLQIYSQDGRLEGFVSVFPADDFFCESGMPDYKTYNYLKFTDTNNQAVYTVVYAFESCNFIKHDPDDSSTDYTRIVNYEIEGRETGSVVPFLIKHCLDDSTGFDPVIEKVIINIIKDDPVAGRKRKGGGTVHTSEGDASGDD